MTVEARTDRMTIATSPLLFAGTAFFGAGLIFFVQPMVAKMLLPLLGGAPAVWNASMAFFQAALLAGYGYAHVLQRISSVRRQAAIHLGVLALGAVALPLRVTGLTGDPNPDAPALWLLATLAVSVGLPFAALSATAPLTQAWHARTLGREGQEPYGLYAASNLGSLIALIAYPLLFEPTISVSAQRIGWSAGYVAFAVLMGCLAASAGRAAPVEQTRNETRAKVDLRDKLAWIGLAAIPSSLMLGVTAHLATDVASAPFLWVLPLALYLLTFVVAFQDKPAIRPQLALLMQAGALPLSLALLSLRGTLQVEFAVHLVAFFFSALVCHQALVARRPPPEALTTFYFCLSLGGVVGGAFNAFAAPVLFNSVYEFPLVLALAAVARPRSETRGWQVVVGAALVAIVALAIVLRQASPLLVPLLLLCVGAGGLLLRASRPVFLAAALVLAGVTLFLHSAGSSSSRSFFGVVKIGGAEIPQRGPVVTMTHGTTLHGAQAKTPAYRCHPTLYYEPTTAIGQGFATLTRVGRPLNVGVVGLGTGAVAAFTRPGDRLTFYEIDPLVIRIANDRRNFTFTTDCAAGDIRYVVGDARLKLQQTDARFDLLMIDAFSSDAIPAHLLTVEAMRVYLDRLAPDGVVLMHVTNRHLALLGPAQAIAEAAGGTVLVQRFRPEPKPGEYLGAPQDVILVARSEKALEPYARSGRWERPERSRAKPWTDDYTNILGALLAGRSH